MKKARFYNKIKWKRGKRFKDTRHPMSQQATLDVCTITIQIIYEWHVEAREERERESTSVKLLKQMRYFHPSYLKTA